MSKISTEVGSAYLLVTPKLSDSGSNLSSSGTTHGTNYGQNYSKGANTALSTGIVALGNILANAATAAASKVGETFVDTFKNYADYEQLVGGVDTLFKESSQIVQQNAAEAFKTTGMSANEYMENVTSFSASLLQGLGGDTERAAAYADMAMRDMSDNANKMGTDMGRITDAYQGFAKQNYTMLDNLKLGYGGTKTEMERLLKDASAIAGVDFNIDNYNDVIEAIHVMQESMGIAGTTAEEAEHTISGSLNMLKASWDNLLTGILNENADLGELFGNLVNSIEAVASNLIPRFAVLFARIFQQLPEAALNAVMNLPSTLLPALQTVFGEQMGQAISEDMSAALEAARDAIGGLVEGVISAVTPIAENIMSLFQAAWPIIMQIVGDAMTFIGGIIDTVWPVVSETIVGAMTTISGIIQDNWPAIQNIVITVMTAIQGFLQQVWPAIQNLISSVMSAISAVMSVAWPVIKGIVSTVMSAILAVVQTVWPAIQGIISTVVGAITGIINGLSSVVGVVTGIFNGVKSAIEDPMNTAKDIIGGIIDTIKGFFNFEITWPHIPLPHFSVSGSSNPLDWLEGGLPSFSIDWYASGGIVDGATLIGAGEAGPEMILPKSGGLMTDFAEAVASADNDEQLIRWLSRNLGAIIHDNAPTISRRDFDRMARGAIA